jgi:hypothetical protein
MIKDLLNIRDYGLVAHLMLSGHKLEDSGNGGFMLTSEHTQQVNNDCDEYFTFYKKRLDAIRKIKKQLSNR